MTKITNLEQLRNKLLDGFENLVDGKIEMEELGVMAKLAETVVSGLKTQMDYARLTGSHAYIPFLADCEHKDMISAPSIKQIAHDKNTGELTHDRKRQSSRTG